jgi:hypothetical protein
MAQACNNIGKELSSSSFSPTISLKQRKKSLKRSAPTNCSSSSTKKSFVPQSSFMFDSLFYHHLNKTNSLLSTSSFNYSPSFHRSSYLMDSILSSPPFVCNWINSTISDGFCGKRFNNYIHLLEHLCTEHTSSYTSY